MTELKTTIHHEYGRIDKVLTNLFTDYSRSQIQLWLKNGAVSVNGQPVKANYKVKQGDEITVLIQTRNIRCGPRKYPVYDRL